jgi:hypothetical protein
MTQAMTPHRRSGALSISRAASLLTLGVAAMAWVVAVGQMDGMIGVLVVLASSAVTGLAQPDVTGMNFRSKGKR